MNMKQATIALCGAAAVYGALAIHRMPSTLRDLVAEITEPVATAAAEVSGTRLKALFVLGADGSQLFVPERMHDSQLDVDCTFSRAADGVVRCLPLSAPTTVDGWARIYFVDSECKQQAYTYLDPPPNGCVAGTLPKYVSYPDSPPVCGLPPGELPNTHLYPLGDPVAPPASAKYMLNGSGTCIPGGGPPSNGVSYTSFTLGAELPASGFVAGTAGVDP